MVHARRGSREVPIESGLFMYRLFGKHPELQQLLTQLDVPTTQDEKQFAQLIFIACAELKGI